MRNPNFVDTFFSLFRRAQGNGFWLRENPQRGAILRRRGLLALLALLGTMPAGKSKAAKSHYPELFPLGLIM